MLKISLTQKHHSYSPVALLVNGYLSKINQYCVIRVYNDVYVHYFKVYFYCVNTSSLELLIRSAQTGPPNARKRHPVYKILAGWSQYCALPRWYLVLLSCLDNLMSYHLACTVQTCFQHLQKF